MKTILTSVLALGAMTSIALATEPTQAPTAPTLVALAAEPVQALTTPAGPVALTENQLDAVTAGAIVGGAVNAQVLGNQNFQAVNNQCQALAFLVC